MPASLVEPIPGWNRLQTRKEPDPESPSSISRKEPNSYSGADSRPESLTPLELVTRTSLFGPATAHQLSNIIVDLLITPEG